MKRSIVEALAPTGAAVLNAEDPLVADMAKYCPGTTVFFAKSGSHPLIVQRRQENARVAFVRDHAIALAEGEYEFTLLSLDRIPLTYGGRIGFQVENVLAATAACWALGLPAEQIRLGLESFSAQMDKVPARFNVFEIRRRDGDRRLRSQPVVAGGDSVGDRAVPAADADGRLLGGRRSARLRHHSPGRAAWAARSTACCCTKIITCAAGRRARSSACCGPAWPTRGGRKRCRRSPTWTSAADAALRLVRPGELLLVQADVVDQAVDYLKAFLTSDAADQRQRLAATVEVGRGTQERLPCCTSLARLAMYSNYYHKPSSLDGEGLFYCTGRFGRACQMPTDGRRDTVRTSQRAGIASCG